MSGSVKKFEVTGMEMALQELEAGTLDPVRRDELMALVSRSPAAQRTYLAYFEMTAMLEAEAATHAEQGNLPKITGFIVPARMFRHSMLAAAAVVTLGGLVAGLIRVALPQPPELALTSAADTLWTAQGDVRDAEGKKATVREGSTLRVKSGTLELRLQSGAAMIIQGPAHVSFPKLTEPELRNGWLWIDSGASHESFVIRTRELRIRNLGTRFGVRVPAEGDAEVHLIRGKLEVSTKAHPENILKLTPVGRGLAIPAQGEPAALNLARDPFPGIAELMAAPANYPTTVRGQNPAGYWKLDDTADGRLRNEVKGGAEGRMRPGVAAGADGPVPAEGLHGFGAGNRAARLPGTSDPPISLGSVQRHDGLLFRESFDGTGPLNRRVPKISMGGAGWTAAQVFSSEGKISPGMASATLPFEPVDGVIYALEAEFRDVTTPPDQDAWVALGFTNGQSTLTSHDDRFISGNVLGRAWMLFRGTGAHFANQAHLTGISAAEYWRNWQGGVGGDIEMRITLDTTRGAGNWTATWFARRPGEDDFIKVCETDSLPNEAIRSVGIATTGETLRARITRFSLMAEAATEPSPARTLADGPAPISGRAGTLSCWLRREPGIGRTEIIWSAGGNPADDAIHARIEADGRVGLFIENGRYDILLNSEETLADGRWHHLAASWSPDNANLYLDGKRVAWEYAERGIAQSKLPELRVGGVPNSGDAAPFTGEIDEVAVWDRALSPVEIERQFRSAVGSSSVGGQIPD
jgi:ferric-dicitrate binding protein FerR (iron transport regulator)